MKTESKAKQTSAIGIFTNVSGESYRVRGVSPMAIEYIKEEAIKEWEKEHNRKLPEKPTYTVTTATGEKETYYHTEETLTSKEDKANWEEFQSAQREVARLHNIKLIRMCALCIEVEPDKLKEWEEEQKFIGVEIPKGDLEKKYRYVETRVITGKVDVIKLMSAVYSITGLASEEDIRKAEKSFLDKVEGSKLRKPKSAKR